MTLGNLLRRQGGRPITPAHVDLTLAVPDTKGGLPHMEDVRVALIPVSEKAKAAAFRAAEAFIAERNEIATANGTVSDAPSPTDERALRLIVAMLRDPDDLRKPFVDDVGVFREAIIAEQVRLLLAAYDNLIASEYPETVTGSDVAAIKREAKANFTDGPASP